MYWTIRWMRLGTFQHTSKLLSVGGRTPPYCRPSASPNGGLRPPKMMRKDDRENDLSPPSLREILESVGKSLWCIIVNLVCESILRMQLHLDSILETSSEATCWTFCFESIREVLRLSGWSSKTLWTLLGNPFDNSQEMLEWIPKKSSGASVCTFFWNPFQNSQEIFTQIHRKTYWICWEISWKFPDRFKVLVKIGQGSGAPWSFKDPEAPEPWIYLKIPRKFLNRFNTFVGESVYIFPGNFEMDSKKKYKRSPPNFFLESIAKCLEKFAMV